MLPSAARFSSPANGGYFGSLSLTIFDRALTIVIGSYSVLLFIKIAGVLSVVAAHDKTDPIEMGLTLDHSEPEPTILEVGGAEFIYTDRTLRVSEANSHG